MNKFDKMCKIFDKWFASFGKVETREELIERLKKEIAFLENLESQKINIGDALKVRKINLAIQEGEQRKCNVIA